MSISQTLGTEFKIASVTTVTLPGFSSIPLEIDWTQGLIAQVHLYSKEDLHYAFAANATAGLAAIASALTRGFSPPGHLTLPAVGQQINKLYVRAATAGNTSEGLSITILEAS